jgi:hypothetical protein
MMLAAKFGYALYQLSNRIDGIDTELEAAEKAGAKPRTDMADDLAEISQYLSMYGSMAQSDPNYSAYAGYLTSSALTCADAADKLERIIRAGDVIGKGWGEALDYPVVFVAAAAAALPY